MCRCSQWKHSLEPVEDQNQTHVIRRSDSPVSAGSSCSCRRCSSRTGCSGGPEPDRSGTTRSRTRAERTPGSPDGTTAWGRATGAGRARRRAPLRPTPGLRAAWWWRRPGNNFRTVWWRQKLQILRGIIQNVTLNQSVIKMFWFLREGLNLCWRTRWFPSRSWSEGSDGCRLCPAKNWKQQQK